MKTGFTDHLHLLMGVYFGGVHSLTLISHVALLGLLIFWEVLVHIIHCDQWPGQVVYVADDLDPRGFGWEHR